MKNCFFAFMILGAGFISCRSDEESLQKIDQNIHLYIDSAGQDMLNSSIPGSYISHNMNDVYGLTENAPVNASVVADADTVRYIDYLAGARRILVDSSAEQRIYESQIALNLTKRLNDSTNSIIRDTLLIQYRSSPQVFEVSQVWYNGSLQFTKTEGLPNIVKIHK